MTRDAGFEIGLLKEPYRGMVPIVSGEIGEDIAYYLAKSEQINSAVSLGVLMTVDNKATGARSDCPGDWRVFTRQAATWQRRGATSSR